MVSKLLIGILLTNVSHALANKNCIPAYEYIPFEGESWAKPDPQTGYIQLGTYSRISPDGKYVLRSLSGQYLTTVTLMKLTEVGEKNKKATAIETDLKNEAFAVQNTWRFIVDINKEHHTLENLTTKGKKSKPDLSAGVNGFYTTAAEISSSNNTSIIRSLSWPSEGDASSSQGQGALYNKIYSVKKNDHNSYSLISESSNHYLCGNLRKTEGSIFTLPMLSMNGSEFSAMPVNPKNHNPTMRIYKIADNNKDCELIDDLGTTASKLIFGHPRPGKKALVSYASGQVYIYDRDLQTHLEINGYPMAIIPDSFPGFTRDGRLVFAAHWSDCSTGTCQTRSGYVRVDPYQTPNLKALSHHIGFETHYPKCITYDDIKDSENWLLQHK